MEPKKYICNSSKYYIRKGYIALECNGYEIPETFEVAGDTLHKIDHFHISLLCVKNIQKMKPYSDDEIVQHFCDYIKEHEVKFSGFTNEFRLASKAERKSVVAMCNVSNLDGLAKYLSEKIGAAVPAQPAHVTIYTLQQNAGIGLNSADELEEKSEPIQVPQSVLAPLMGYKKVVVVDENDTEIGTEYMMDAIQKGMIRRAARVYVFNESGQLLVQQRGKNVLKPLLLDQSAAGHVDIGESYEQAAHRELQEELGLANVNLALVETSLRTTDFYNAIYKVVVSDDTQIDYEPEELNAVVWYNTDTLDKEMDAAPENFTAAFLEAWSLLRDKLVQQPAFK